MSKLDRFHALALVHGKPGRVNLSDPTPMDSMIPRKLRIAIKQVCTPEEIGRWGGVAKVAHDYAFWYRAEELKL